MHRYMYLNVFTVLSVPVNCLLPCLTWEIKGGSLLLTCQLTDFSFPVYFYGNRGNIQGQCSFERACDNISTNNLENRVTLKLEAIVEYRIIGEWSCVQGNKTYTSFVNTLADYVKVSNLAIKGVRNSTSPAKTINITCSSCQRPFSNGVEFLVNGRTVDTVNYYPEPDRCTHSYGDCSPSDTCSCSFQGHQFSRVFEIADHGINFSISCLAIFKDDSGFLHRISTILFDENGFTQLGSNDTVVPVHPKDHNTPNQKEIIIVSVIMFTVFIVFAIICVKKRRQELKKKKSYDSLPLDEKRENDKNALNFDEWEKDDETFTVTRATRYVQSLIKKEDIVTVTGDSGTGKSSLIHHVALTLRTDYDVIPNVTCPGDIIRNLNKKKPQIFVMDDVCGKNSINEQSLHEWLEFDDEFKQGGKASNTAKIKILITCRLQIFNNPRFQTLKIFTDNVCNLQYDDHCLLPVERRNIFECHLPGNALQDLKQFLSKNEYVETLDDLFGKFHCFPLLCRLSHGKTSEQLYALFTTPVESITSDIKLSIRYWSFNYHALVFCCMFQTGFDEGCIDNPNEKQKIEDILSSLEISLEEEKTRQMLRKAFDLLDGKFLQKKGSKYFIIHDKVFDIISNIWIKELPKLFAKNTTF